MTVSPQDIERAARRVRGHVRETPLVEVGPGTFGVAIPLILKLELLQHTGSFKPRGAFHNLLVHPIPPAGVVAASGGNHGIAVAYAASRLGVKARIFVPKLASPIKVARIQAFGAEVTVEGERYTESLALAEAYQRQSGALSVHAYDSLETVAGQGTLGRESDPQCPRLHTLLLPLAPRGLIP